jgi:hypothetical protein
MNKTESLAKPCPERPTHHRQRGQLVREIIQLLIEKPDITLNQMACQLGCGHENVRRRYVSIVDNPDKYSAVAQCDIKELKKVLNSREWGQKTGLGLQHRSSWPAWKAAGRIVGGTAVYAYKDRFEEL